MPDEEWVEAACLTELSPGHTRRVEVAGRVLALVSHGGSVHAVDAVCPHQGGPLDEGVLWGNTLECPWHHFLFDLETGTNVYPANVYPADMPELRAQVARVKVFPVRIEGDRVFIRFRKDQQLGGSPPAKSPVGKRTGAAQEN